jgi:rod shape-determining protein MreD
MIIPFCLALFAALFGTAVFSACIISAFLPFLAIVATKKGRFYSLWMAFGCGLIIDLMSTAMFGLYALNFVITTAIVYSQKRHFFDEKPLAIPLFTLLFSLVSTTIQLVELYVIGKPVSISFPFILADWFGMGIVDALYALVWFTWPMKGIALLRRRPWKKRVEDGATD